VYPDYPSLRDACSLWRWMCLYASDPAAVRIISQASTTRACSSSRFADLPSVPERILGSSPALRTFCAGADPRTQYKNRNIRKTGMTVSGHSDHSKPRFSAWGRGQSWRARTWVDVARGVPKSRSGQQLYEVFALFGRVSAQLVRTLYNREEER
jgi:hypothetical protein